jgi:heme oxygenase
MVMEGRIGPAYVLNRLRQETGAAHRRLEQRFDAVAELQDPSLRPAAIARFAALYSSAHAALAAELEPVEGLEYSRRIHAWRAARPELLPSGPSINFSIPAGRHEALGAFYVVEGSTLGGRVILRELSAGGVADPALRFLDPYGPDAGSMWRSLLAVLEREGAEPDHVAAMCRGASHAFAHAERVFCGEVN